MVLDSTTNFQLQESAYEELVYFPEPKSDESNEEKIDYRYKSRRVVLTELENQYNNNIDCNYVYASNTLILENLLDHGYRKQGYTIYPTNGRLSDTKEENYAIAFNKEDENLEDQINNALGELESSEEKTNEERIQ